MTITTIRFTACGDIHHNLINLDKIKAFILDMKNQGKIDFAGFVGDYVSSSADLTQFNDVKARFDALGIKYYAATGNHDASGSNCYTGCSNTSPAHAAGCVYKTSFGYFPDQYPPVTDFTKDGITFQILVPGMCWSGGAFWKYDFANANISKTKPTIVFNHGPVLKPAGITCGAWDSLHEYAFNMKPQLDVLNMLAIYSGHVHAAGFQIINNRLYASQDSINSSRCSGTADKHRNIGYTKITYDSSTNKATIQYQNMEYMNASNVANKFVDPFPDTVTKYSCTGSPDFQCVVDPNGPYNTLAECQTACHAPAQKYRCTGSPDFQCVVDPNGPYATLAECQAACKPPVTKYRCTGSPDFQCIVDPNGPYNTLAECQVACKPPVQKYRCTGSPNFQCVVDPNGPYATLAECQAVCKAPSQGSIIVTNPITGVAYRKGESRVIRWKSTGSIGPNVKIELLKVSTVVKVITSGTSNDGQMAWTIPIVTSGTDYRIKIISKTNAQIFGIGGKFTIK